MAYVTRYGRIDAIDATLAYHRQLLVREMSDGSVEYYLDNASRNRNGWSLLSPDQIARVTWDRLDDY